ncbi:LuxR C-terminal-related transcriptional regulator [Noviherbaspirillum sp. ST9]|uniref:LuxR C-terminal-related transcriptional regulator n=1 Tax=Noviherbaspirillum sp. ST9 TaxID=3401606 RepID=UPI003B589712
MKANRVPDQPPPAGAQPGTGNAGTPAAPAAPELTPRQQQILDLLRAGKVNKEIAKELGIEIGTVKQHVVALFKRLNVSNRTMAVSRGIELLGGRPAPTPAPATLADGLLERRPCVVLSLALPEAADDASVRRLHGALAALAFDQEAVFLARRGHAGDLIFGLHQASERDLLKALHTARQAFEDLHVMVPDWADGMRGGVTAGLVVASMLRSGGWSGEAIVSTAIASARELQEQAPAGRVAIGGPALDLLRSFGIRGEAALSENAGLHTAAFPALTAFEWSGDRAIHPLVGREGEVSSFRRILNHAGSGQGKLVFLEGETGMGKSRLCREFLAMCRADGGQAVLHRVQADTNNLLRDPESGASSDAARVFSALPAPIPGKPSLAIVDDCHFLSREVRPAVGAAAAKAVRAGWTVLLAGRHMPELDHSNTETIRLQRQSARDIESLVRQALGPAEVPAKVIHQIAKDAAGVPLFAVELARQPDSGGIAMSLLVTIASRLDGLRLDRKLLRTIARSAQPPTPEEVTGMLGENNESVAQALRRAMATGVLQTDAGGRLAFAHPLVRKIIDHVSLE